MCMVNLMDKPAIRLSLHEIKTKFIIDSGEEDIKPQKSQRSGRREVVSFIKPWRGFRYTARK